MRWASSRGVASPGALPVLSLMRLCVLRIIQCETAATSTGTGTSWKFAPHPWLKPEQGKGRPLLRVGTVWPLRLVMDRSLPHGQCFRFCFLLWLTLFLLNSLHLKGQLSFPLAPLSLRFPIGLYFLPWFILTVLGTTRRVFESIWLVTSKSLVKKWCRYC